MDHRLRRLHRRPYRLILLLQLLRFFADRPAPLALWIGLDNYRQLINDSLFWKSLGNTLYYAAMALPAGMLVSLGLALLLNAKIRGQSIYRAVIFYRPSFQPSPRR